MSSKNKVEVLCPQCSEEQSVIVWSSLNTTLNPEAQQDLFNKKINVFQCKECSSELKVRTRLMYHDMEKEFCVQYIPIENIIEDSQISEFNQFGELENCNNKERKDDPYDYMNHIHLVFDMEELLRYIVFREKLFESYKESFEVDDENQETQKIKERLLEIRQKARHGEPNIDDMPIFIYPEDFS